MINLTTGKWWVGDTGFKQFRDKLGSQEDGDSDSGGIKVDIDKQLAQALEKLKAREKEEGMRAILSRRDFEGWQSWGLLSSSTLRGDASF